MLAEKKRRARINNCLSQIRDIVCEGHDENDTDLDKMEKAEILEKTLEVLTKLRSQNKSYGSGSFPARRALAVKYASGFSSCAEESIRYIQCSKLVPPEVKVQIQNHLRSKARQVETVVQVTDTNVFNPTYQSYAKDFTPIQQASVRTGESRSCYIPSPIQSSTPISNPTPRFPVDEKQHFPDSTKVDSLQQDVYQQIYKPSAQRALNVHENSAFVKMSPSPVVPCPNSAEQPTTPVCRPQQTSGQTGSQGEQVMYTYYGYEPFPITPVSQYGSDLSSPVTPNSAVNLCTKPSQISPDAMWRPW